jgi:hypothetical protein
MQSVIQQMNRVYDKVGDRIDDQVKSHVRRSVVRQILSKVSDGVIHHDTIRELRWANRFSFTDSK